MPISNPGRTKEKYQVIGQKGARDVRLSLESGEQGAVRFYFPFNVQIDKIRSIVTADLAGTDSGTVTGSNSTGASTGGVITHSASAAAGDEQTATPTDNNEVKAGSYYELDPAKTTAGGHLAVSLEYTVIR